MSNDNITDEKKVIARNQDGKQKMIQYKPFKSKVEGLEEAVFESGTLKHAAQFTKMLKEILKYVQKNTTVTLLR